MAAVSGAVRSDVVRLIQSRTAIALNIYMGFCLKEAHRRRSLIRD
ncbi:MAG: hypothetical protein PHY77_01715 [Desulfotomaculaceae bacterium]|nr:hypothetical protein [Desulfotomaculaceae bacterium]